MMLAKSTMNLIALIEPARYMERIHCIVNPASERPHMWETMALELQKKESRRFKVVAHITEIVGHASHIAWQLTTKGKAS